MIESELPNFYMEPKYKRMLEKFQVEVENLQENIKKSEITIFDEITELKRQVDLDREALKKKIDDWALDLIKQLESYEKSFKEDYSLKIVFFNNLLESSKKQLAAYEKCLNLFSTKTEDRDKEYRESWTTVDDLQTQIKELKEKVVLNLTIKYKPMQDNFPVLFGKLILKVSSD